MVDTRLKQLEEAQMGMAREMSEFRLAVDGQQKLMQEVRNQVSPLGSQLKAPSVESSRSKSAEVILSSRIDDGNPVMLRHKRASVELSRFSGEHPDAWLVDWTHFASKLLIRFRKRELEDPEGRLAKLRQTSTVADYQARFEAFANETADIPDTLMVKLFVSGLCLDIKTNVLVHKPSTLDEAISLAHTHEQHLNLEKGPMQPSFARTQPLLPNLQSRSLAPSRNTGVPSAKFPIKRLSPVEMQQRREKGLCYYCDEKYVANHRYPNLPQIHLLEDDSDPLSSALEIPPWRNCNGQHLRCEGVIRDVRFSVQRTDLAMDLHVLDFHRADVVLGGAWLTTLGPILTDHSKRHMEFYLDSKQVQWGLPPVRATDHAIHITPNVGPINKDGSWHFCVDYRALNAITVRDRFPIPFIDELFDELYRAQFFSKLDLLSGYHLIRVRPVDVPNTAFKNHDGHYEFLVMPFGLTNAPSTFQATMNDVFRPYLRKFVLVFFDDILIYSTLWLIHLEHLELVFKLLQQHQLVAKRSKCQFGKRTIDYLCHDPFSKQSHDRHPVPYLTERTGLTILTWLHNLGHVISPDGLAVDPSKISTIKQWAAPKIVKEVRSFLGLAGYYRRFIHHFAIIACPLFDLLRTDAFLWTAQTQQAFEELKIRLSSTPILALPNFDDDFHVETDASGVGIGVILSLKGHPIAYYSQKLIPQMQKASTYHREIYAITQAVAKWRQYLLGRRFIIFTDQQSLKNLTNQNKAVDALPRPPDAGVLFAISERTYEWLGELLEANKCHPEFGSGSKKRITSGRGSSSSRYTRVPSLPVPLGTPFEEEIGVGAHDIDYVESQENYGIEEENEVDAVNLEEDNENIGETPAVLKNCPGSGSDSKKRITSGRGSSSRRYTRVPSPPVSLGTPFEEEIGVVAHDMDYVEAQENYGIEEENKVDAVNLDEDNENIGDTPAVENANVRSE
ncbi:hypothetical protein FXO38_08178 [Capsicum annuum]|nr:hypothetical protein FXO38_08178 [Capsicum annuum]